MMKVHRNTYIYIYKYIYIYMTRDMMKSIFYAVPIHCKNINEQIKSTCCAIVAKNFGARRGLYGNGSNITSIRK